MRLFFLAGGWLLGLYLGSATGLPIAASASLTAAAAALAFVLRGRWRLLIGALFAVGAMAGMLRIDLDRPPEDHLSQFGGKLVSLRGTVGSTPGIGEAVSSFDFLVHEVVHPGGTATVSGTVRVTSRPTEELVRLRDPPHFRSGDLLSLEGRLEAPSSFANFDYPSYLAHQGIHWVMPFPRVSLTQEARGLSARRGLSAIRVTLAKSLSSALPEPQNGLAQAITLGLRDDIGQGLREHFQDSGTTHLLAVSGLHVAIVAGLVLAAVRRLLWRPRALLYLIPMLAVWAYAALAGLPPSAQRAAIMATFLFGALALGRQRHGLEALILATFLITVFSPESLWRISFQLSFLAMAGIILVGLPALERSGPSSDSSGIAEGVMRGAFAMLVMGVAATLFTLPAVAFYFQHVSLVGVPATALALPAMPFALIASLLTSLVGLVSSDASWIIGWAAWLGLGYIILVAHLFAAIPLASLQLNDIARGAVWAYYAVLFAAAWAVRGVDGLRDRLRTALPQWPSLPSGPSINRFQAAVAALVVLAALAWWAALSGTPRNLELTALDIGQGDALLVRTPGGHTLLVDGGPDPRSLRRALDAQLPNQIRHLDMVIATHADRDHLGGLVEGLDRYSIGAVIQPEPLGNSATAIAWARALKQREVTLVPAAAGQRIRLGHVHVEVLHPPQRPLTGTASDDDNNSVVLRLSYGNASFLLTGDIHAVAEDYLLSQDISLASTVLKVAHHGSATSTDPAFLEEVLPRVAVVSAARDSRFHHPSPEVVARLLEHVDQQALFVTARDGWVRLSTDGDRLWATTER